MVDRWLARWLYRYFKIVPKISPLTQNLDLTDFTLALQSCTGCLVCCCSKGLFPEALLSWQHEQDIVGHQAQDRIHIARPARFEPCIHHVANFLFVIHAHVPAFGFLYAFNLPPSAGAFTHPA